MKINVEIYMDHNGRVTFYCQADELDSVGRVIDFSVIKTSLCNWWKKTGIIDF